MFYLTSHSTHGFTVIWRRIYGKGELSLEAGVPETLYNYRYRIPYGYRAWNVSTAQLN